MKLSLIQKIEAFVIGLVVVIAVIALVHRDGEKKGAVRQELKTNAAEVKQSKAEVVVARAESEQKREVYHVARSKVVLEGDTVVADGKTVELPSVATLIKVADARGAKDSTSLAKQDLLIATLGKRVDLLQQEKEPWCGRRCGITIGVAGTIGVAYVIVKVVLPLVRHK